MAVFHPLLETGDKILLETGTDALLVESDYALEVLKDGAFLYYRLGDAVASATVADSVGSRSGDAVGSPTFGTTGALVGDPNTAMTGAVGTKYVSMSSAPGAAFNISTTGAISYELWLLFSPSDSGLPVQIVNQWQLQSDASLGNIVLYADAYQGGGVLAGNTGFVGSWPIAAVWRHIVVTMTASSLSLYVDAVLVTTIALVSAGVDSGNFLTVGGTDKATDEFAVYSVALTPAQIQAHYEIGSGKFHRKLNQLPQLVAQ